MIRSKIHTFILSELQASVSRRKAQRPGLTIGAEHEFFLKQETGGPCSHEQSQLFLRNLAEQPGWTVRERGEWKGEPILVRVSRECPGGRYTAVKYDHHPHLMEIAFAYEFSLSEFARSVEETFRDLNRAAAASKTQLSSQPVLDISPSDPRVQSALDEFVALRHYRGKLFLQRGEDPHPDAVNYAAVIAATQVHIGGLDWWKRPGFVEALYGFEPELLYWNALGALSEPMDPSELLKERWGLFLKTFEGYPLSGFPRMDSWSLESWVDSLLHSPLAGSQSEQWAGRSVMEWGSFPFSEMQTFMKRVRDLQIIRPKLFGTLEFRADPAQASPEGIVRLAALRLGLCYAVLDGARGRSFGDARRSWNQAVTGRGLLRSNLALHVASTALTARQLGEERFLEAA